MAVPMLTVIKASNYNISYFLPDLGQISKTEIL